MQPNDYDKEVIPAPDSAVVFDEQDDPCPTTGGKKKTLNNFARYTRTRFSHSFRGARR
jgi:hypothetical protein